MKVEEEVIHDDDNHPPIRRSTIKAKKKDLCSYGCCLGVIMALMSICPQTTDSIPIQTQTKVMTPSWYDNGALETSDPAKGSFANL